MSNITGRETVAYYANGSTWGTESTSGEGLKLIADGLSFKQQMTAVEENDSTWLKEYDQEKREAAFNCKQLLSFDDIRCIAQVLGTADYQAVTELNAGQADYQHEIFPAAENSGDFATMAIKKGDVIQTLPSVKFAGFTLTGKASPNRIEASYKGIASALLNSSSQIVAASFDSLVTPTGPGGRGYFRSFEVALNSQSDAALDAADNLKNAITGFDFAVQRKLIGDYTNDSGLEIEEPVEDGYLEATLTLQIRNLDGLLDGLYTDWLDGVAKKLMFSISGGPASSSGGSVADSLFKIEAPKALIHDVDFGAYSGPGRIGGAVTFKLLGSDSTVAGMAFDQPFKLTVINNQSQKAIN
jgi:hypothetical protein